MLRLLLSTLFACCVLLMQAQSRATTFTNVLYNTSFNNKQPFPELLTSAVEHHFEPRGIVVTGKTNLVKLDRYYSLAERLVRYHVKFSADCKAVFQSDKGDFKAYVDVTTKTIEIATNPITKKKVPFLDPTHEYIVEIHRYYQTSTVRIIDLYSGQSTEVSATMNGVGGHGKGAMGKGFAVGRQYDYYCFGLVAGTSITIRQLCVLSKESNLTLLIYGDSITEPEGYFPSADFDRSWTQLIMKNVRGAAMSSGRGGTTIKELLDRIKNELPYVKAKYVMVTIGTNGGNTEQNLSELIEYILAQGSIPILNNIPSNESATQIKENMLIARIRQKYNIKGCMFDLATSLRYDGAQVDTTTMYFEDYDWGKIYHHPNVKGSLQMFTRTLIDVPEIYE